MELSLEVRATPVGVALSGLSAALGELIDAVEGGGLDDLPVMGVVEAVRAFECVRNQMALVDHRIVADCDRRQVADELNLRNTRALLINVLRLSSLESGRRVRAAAAVGARTSMVGEPIEPLRPILAAAQREGETSPEQIAAAEESLRAMEHLDASADEVASAEQTLAEYARAFEPRALYRVGEKLAEVAAPDGRAPDDAVLQWKRRFQMATGRDGSVRGKFCLTPDVGAALAAVLSPLAKPRKDPPVDGGHLADAHQDSRTPEQRQHDALGDLCSWALRGGGLADQAGADQAGGDGTDSGTAGGESQAPAPPVRPGPPGAPATVIITIDINDLINRTGHGETGFGAFLSPEQILRIAGEAEIYPVVMTATGVPLCLGRTRRIASRSQSMALIARDGGCSFPGCDHPPEWCDRHHVTAWVDGGLTDLKNLTLLCRYHHTRFLGKGWTCRINADGVPAWVPPRWQDPSQTAIVHLRILRRQLERRIERTRPARPTRESPSPPLPGGRSSLGPTALRPTALRPTESTPDNPTPSDSATAGPSAGTESWLDIVAADLRRAQIAREAVLSAAAEERGRRLGTLWCPDEGDDLNACSWISEEVWEAGWRPVDPCPEGAGSPRCD